MKVYIIDSGSAPYLVFGSPSAVFKYYEMTGQDTHGKTADELADVFEVDEFLSRQQRLVFSCTVNSDGELIEERSYAQWLPKNEIRRESFLVLSYGYAKGISTVSAADAMSLAVAEFQKHKAKP